MKTHKQMIAALRRQLLAQWVVVGALVLALVILLVGTVTAVDKPVRLAPEILQALPGEVIGPAPTEPDGAPPEPEWTSFPAEGPVISLGDFTIYAYCPCARCCGKWAGGPTASGVMPQAGRTVAVDPNVIPVGSLILVGGVAYIAEDTGHGIEGNALDIYMDSHSAALEHGVQTAEVWLIGEE